MRALAAVALCAGWWAAAAQVEQGKQGPGERAFLKCYSCHSLEPDRNDLDGPTLYGVVGRKIASEPFDYSPAMTGFVLANPTWTRDLVDRFAADPEQLVPGTTMAFHGIEDPAERAALLDYLETVGGQTRAKAASRP